MITCSPGGDPRTTRYLRGCLVAVIVARPLFAACVVCTATATATVGGY